MWHSWCVVTSSIVPALKTFQSKGIAPSYLLGQLHEERGGWTYNMSYVLCAIVSGDITRLSIDPFCTFVLCHTIWFPPPMKCLCLSSFYKIVILKCLSLSIHSYQQSSYQYSSLTPLEINDQIRLKSRRHQFKIVTK